MERVVLEFFEEESVWKGNHRVEVLVRGIVPGVLPMQRDAARGKLQYDTSGYVSLEVWCRTCELGERELRWLLKGIVDIMQQGEAFLLRPGHYFLTPDHIFVKPSKELVGLCVRPEGEAAWEKQLQETGRFFLEAIDYKEEEGVKLAYEFYHLCKKEGLRLEDCRELLRAKVYTIITEDGECSKSYQEVLEQPGESVFVGAATSWIEIEADYEGREEQEAVVKRRREDMRKKMLRLTLAGVAVLLLFVVLWQSGF